MKVRDITIAAVAVVVTVGVIELTGARQQEAAKPPMSSSIFQWEAFQAKPTKVGAVRQVFRTPTATLDELEYHITTLNPGQSSHAPHQHVNEELIIVREGSVEAFSNGKWTPVSAGSLIFNASNQLHAIRNAGTTPATYHVVNWSSPGMLKKTQKPAP